MDGSSSVSSSKYGRSRGHASPAKKSDELTASHESGEESSGNPPDGTRSQRHADYTPPNVRQRNESRSLLHPASESEKRGATDVKQKTESKNLDTPKTVLTSTQSVANVSKPSLMPSLAPNGVRQNGPTAAPSAKTGFRDSLHATMRKMALAPDTSANAMKTIKALYTDDIYKQIPEKEEIILGKTTPISSHVVTPEENSNYLHEVFDLYKVNADDAAVKRMAEQFAVVEKFERVDQIFDAGHAMVTFMFSTLTPNQRNKLRQDFPLLYWKTTIADDVNWLFFDTIICLSTTDDDRQKEIMLAIREAPKERLYRKRSYASNDQIFQKFDNKIRNEALRTKDKITTKIHRNLSMDQRSKLKKVCKARHDELTASRLPILHVLIRQQDEKAMKAYIGNVLQYAPPNERVRLLLARPDTPKGKETGDASVFALANSGNDQMLASYMAAVLSTQALTPAQKYEVLRAVRLEDGISAFHMMMCQGDWPRVACFTNQIHSFIHSRYDYFGAYTNTGTETIQMTVERISIESLHDMLGTLLEAPVDDHTRRNGFRSAYTSAREMGKKECAHNFKKLINRRDKYFLLSDYARQMASDKQPANISRLTSKECDAARKKANDEYAVNQIGNFLEIESRPLKSVQYEIRVEKEGRERTMEEIAINLEKYPELKYLTMSEHEINNLVATGKNQYNMANITLLNRLEIEKAKTKKAEKKSIWPSFSKSARNADPAKASFDAPIPSIGKAQRPALNTGLAYYPKGTVRGRFRPRMQPILEPYTDLTLDEVRGLNSTPGFSVLHYRTPVKGVPNESLKSPLSPYQAPIKRDRKTQPAKATGESDEQPLIDASEGA